MSIPADDDIYLNDGETYQDAAYYADEPLERKEAEQTAAAILVASYPVMGDVHAWFDEQIEATDSRRNIKAYAESHGLELELCAKAFDIVRELLEAKQQDFSQFRKEEG